MDRALPGFAPGFIRITLHRTQPGGVWDLRWAAAEAEGFLTAADVTLYDLLTWGEACDVLSAHLDAVNGYA